MGQIEKPPSRENSLEGGLSLPGREQVGLETYWAEYPFGRSLYLFSISHSLQCCAKGDPLSHKLDGRVVGYLLKNPLYLNRVPFQGPKS